MRSAGEEAAIREDVFRWLDDIFIGRGGYEIPRAQLLSYEFRGERIPLLDTGRGIRNPADFSSTLSIMSGWEKNRYEDYESDDGWITYHHRASDGGDSVKLIRAFENQHPIVYFRAVREGYYLPHYPIRIAENDPVARVVRFPLDEGLAVLGDPRPIRTRSADMPIASCRRACTSRSSARVCCMRTPNRAPSATFVTRNCWMLHASRWSSPPNESRA